MSSWHSYPKLYNLGHSALKLLALDSVIVEEKVDGSQFSFGKFNGELRCRSKGKELGLDAPEKMFNKAVEVVKSISPLLVDGWTYRGEYLQAPKHNALAYDRIPQNHIIIFDINTGEEEYLPYAEKAAEAKRLGLEVVPLIFEGVITDYTMFDQLIRRKSLLGGKDVEGVVIKNYKQFGSDKKVLMGKHVSEAFKEVHRKEWKKDQPSQTDAVMGIIGQYRSQARWNKAIQHLKERGELTNTPKDIAALIKEVQVDVKAECASEIKQQLFDWVDQRLNREIIRGLPEWYKDQLAQAQFNQEVAL